MEGLGDISKLPKGMEIPKDVFTQQQEPENEEIKQNLKLKEINYVTMIINKLQELDIDIEVKNLTVNENNFESHLLLDLKLFKKGVK